MACDSTSTLDATPRAAARPLRAWLVLSAMALTVGALPACSAASDGPGAAYEDEEEQAPEGSNLGQDEEIAEEDGAICGDGEINGAETCDDGDTSDGDNCSPVCQVQEVVQVETGDLHTCARLSDGSVKCWGLNSSGQLGVKDTFASGDEPSEMGSFLPATSLPSKAVDIATGVSHGCALVAHGAVFCWGLNANGRLGLGTSSQAVAPAPHGPLTIGNVVEDIEAGDDHTCALLRGGAVKCWGMNSSGQLGTGDLNDRFLPSAPIDLGPDKSAVAISAGARHTCALLNDGAVKCWGHGGSGRLGTGNDSDALVPPAQRVNLGSGKTARAISAGADHTCALLNDNTVKCWGQNESGQLGTGDQTARLLPPASPVNLGQGEIAVAISAGAVHTCALLSDGIVKCWGDNGNGLLGLNSALASSSAPIAAQLGDGKTAVAIKAGHRHSCAILSEGSMKCWGLNAQGELGLGDTLTRGDDPNEMGDNLPTVKLFSLNW